MVEGGAGFEPAAIQQDFIAYHSSMALIPMQDSHLGLREIHMHCSRYFHVQPPIKKDIIYSNLIPIVYLYFN